MRTGKMRCGCMECKPTGYSPAGDYLPCCQYCDESPCEFLVLWECPLDYGVIEAHAIHALRRECPFGTNDEACIWTGHRDQQELPDSDLQPVGVYSVCNHVDSNGWHWWPGAPGGAIKFPGRYGEGLQADINVQWDTPAFGCRPFGREEAARCWWRSTTNNIYPELNLSIIEWALEVTSSTSATLTGYPELGSGYSNIVYTCDDFDCTDRSTFTMTDYPHPDFPAFPRKVCVVPGYTEFENPCSSTTAFCNCCDSGEDTAYLDINLGDCGGLHEDVLIARNATLPTGVTDPSAPCGYFWGTITPDDCAVQFGVLTYCDGEDWHVDLWCNNDGGGWNEIDTATATLTACCPGAVYEWTWSGDWGDCCCPEEPPNVPSDCCEDGIPATLTLTFNSACAEVDGVVVTVTNVGIIGPYNLYEGTGTFGTGCGSQDITLKLDETLCYMIIESDNLCFPPLVVGDSGTPVLPCPFTSYTSETGNWQGSAGGGGCNCCDGNTFTVDVSA